MSNSTPYDVVVVGGGLSGLLVAHQIVTNDSTKATNWRLLEAREQLGGRLENDDTGDNIDLGGAWIWPMYQPYMSSLVKSLGIKTFVQPDDESSTRIQGGAAEIVERLSQQLPPDRIQTKSPVVACRLEEANTDTCPGKPQSPHVKIELESGEELFSRYVVLAAPPKLLSKHVTFEPPLSSGKTRAMEQSQTWMAGVTKVALVYKSSRFWPLSISNTGFRPSPNAPAFQVYDGSPEETDDESSLSALTFFTLASLSEASNNDDEDATLARHCAEQMASHVSSNSRSYVPNAITNQFMGYDEFHVKRWPNEKHISEEANPRGINPHPQPVPILSKSEWDGRLLFAGTETDLSSPGVMEGAVGAAKRAFQELKSMLEAS